jgi:hypothetical protein
MADLSSSSNLMALEGLPEDLRKGIHEKILPHCYQDLPRHRKSFANLLNGLLAFVR